MATRYYWLKLQDGFFGSKRIKKLRKIAGGDTYTIIYLKMQLLAMKNNGVLEYTGLESTFAEELALDLDEEPENVSVTVNYLLSCGLMETNDNKEFFIPYAVMNTGSETAAAKRVRDHRERKALQCNADVTGVKRIGNVEKEKEKEKEKEIEEDSITVSSDTVRQTQSVRRVVEAWNELKSYGIKEVIKLSSESKRYGSLCARIDQYGIETVLKAIENIKHSDFLQGKSKKGWVITFDWFVLPNNFPKVLEGNYDNKEGGYGKKTHMLTKEENDARRNGADWMLKYMTRPEPKTAGDDPDIRERAEKLQRELKGENDG